MEKKDNLLNVEQAKEQIKKYFGKSLKDLNVVFVPPTPEHGLYNTFIDITYRDFKPVQEVRKDLEQMFVRPFINLTRLFSDKVMKKAVRYMQREMPDIDESMLSDDDFICEVEAWLYDKQV